MICIIIVCLLLVSLQLFSSVKFRNFKEENKKFIRGILAVIIYIVVLCILRFIFGPDYFTEIAGQVRVSLNLPRIGDTIDISVTGAIAVFLIFYIMPYKGKTQKDLIAYLEELQNNEHLLPKTLAQIDIQKISILCHDLSKRRTETLQHIAFLEDNKKRLLKIPKKKLPYFCPNHKNEPIRFDMVYFKQFLLYEKDSINYHYAELQRNLSRLCSSIPKPYLSFINFFKNKKYRLLKKSLERTYNNSNCFLIKDEKQHNNKDYAKINLEMAMTTSTLPFSLKSLCSKYII